MSDSPAAGEPPAADSRALLARLVELEARVADLEAGRTRAVGVGDEPAVEAEAAEEPRRSWADFVHERREEPDPVPDPEPEPATAEAATGPAVVPYEAPAPVEAAGEDDGFERAIGLKLAGWAGAGIVVFGLVLGAKYAYEAGLVGLIPAGVRLALLFAAGAGLIVGGEVVLRRVGVAAAAGLFAAGVAILFVSAYSGHAALGVYGETAALVLMGLAAAVGAATAVRARLVSVALLALGGGHLAPLILGGRADSPVPLLAYVAAVQAAVLVAAWRGSGPRWWLLRWSALLAAAGWITAVLVLADAAPTAAVFAAIYAVVFVFELVPSSRSIEEPRGELRFDSDFDFGKMACLFVVTLAAGLAAATFAGVAPRELAAALLVAQAAAWFAVSFAFAFPIRVACRAVAATVLAAAVPTAFGGATVVLAWGGMAIAFGVVGARLRDPLARAASVATWAAGLCYLALAVGNPDVPAAGLLDEATLGLPVATYAVAAWAMTLIGLAVGRLLAGEDARAGRIVSVAAGVVAVAAAVAALPTIPATVALLIYGWLLALLARPLRPLMPAAQSLAVMAIALAKWALIDLLAERLDGGWTARQLGYLPAANPLTLLGSLVLASLLAIAWLNRAALLARAPRSPAWFYAGVAGLVTAVGLGLCLEVDRVIESATAWPLDFPPARVGQLAFTSIAAACLAAYAGIVLWRERDPDARRGPLLPAAVAACLLAAKFLLVDCVLTRGMVGGTGVPVANPETIAAAVVLGAIALLVWHRRDGWLAFAGLATLLCVGGFEVWRTLGRLNAGPLTRQAAVSAYLAAFAVASVVAGFRYRVAGLRYFGLLVLAVAGAKAFLLDLQTLSRGWRTVSFVVLGLFLLGTSVLYGRHAAPRRRE